ncbi:MAG: FAD-binding protein, partial [Steroidobacteraceae bacterium]
GALNLRALAFLTRTMFAHGLDRMRHGRAARLYGGQALAARLMRSALDRGVKLWLSSPARSLRTSEGAVTGVEVQHDGAQVAVYARRGVVLACGGFPQDPARQRELYAHVRRGAHHFSAASVGSNGEGLRLGESVGASVATPASPAAWLPVSLSERDGRREVVPHLSDRAKPGVISIGHDGRRFVNEAGSYHDFVTALLAAYPDAPHAWLICDHKALRRYGLGLVRPRPLSPRAHLRSGYIMRAISVEQLAQRIDVEPGVLAQTIARFNEDARQGSDTAFARGSTAYNRRMGDPAQRPNPCLRALDFAPFYAVKIWPGDLGTFSGLRTDTNARVLGGAGPIRGLYAAGADMINPLGGAYPGAGATLGPALVFGWLAAQHAAGFSD